MPPPRMIEGHEVDGLLVSESPSKEADSSCWGRKRKKKKKSLQEDTVSFADFIRDKEQSYSITVFRTHFRWSCKPF